MSPVTVFMLASLALFTFSRGLAYYSPVRYLCTHFHRNAFVYILSKDAFNFKGKV